MEQTQHNTMEILKNDKERLNGIEKIYSGKEIRFISSPEKPLIAILEKEINNERLFTGYFAYRLECIGKPRTKEEEEKMQNQSLEFHRNLSYILNNHYPHASFTIRIVRNSERKNQEKKSSPIEITFIVRSQSQSLEIIKKNLHHLSDELKLFMQKSNADNFHPFFFSPVMNENDLQDSIRIKLQQYAVCTRSCICFQENSKVGFNKSADENGNIFLPRPIKVHDFSLGSLLQILSRLNQYAEVNLFLRPTKLKEENIKQIKELISKTGLLYEEFPDETERKEYISYCRNFLQNTPLFFAGVTFSSDNAVDNNILKNAISNAFTNSFHVYQFEAGQNELKYLPCEPSESELPKTDLRFLYTSDDFVSAFRFPIPQMDGINGVENKPTSYYYLPEDLHNDGILLGIKKLQDKNVPIYISNDALRRHIYILGGTGTGKTTMIRTMLMNLINSGHGCALIDPHGDLIKSILNSIPSWRKNDVILFDPTDIKNNKLRINILEYHPDFTEQRTFIFNELIKLLTDLYRDTPESIGPAFELYFRTFLYLVMNTVKGTLADVMRALREKTYRDQLLKICKDDDMKLTIENFLENTGEQSFPNWVPYITNKFQRFTNDDFLAPIISEPVSNINFRHIIDNNKILLVKLTKSRLGDEGVKFIGTIIFNRLIYAAYSRENIEEKDRVDYTLFVDECQNFTSSDINIALSEARKYRLRLCLANQTTAQLKDTIVDSIMGNVGNFISFRPGIPDIEKVGAYFHPYFTKKDLLDLENFQCAARLLLNNKPSKPFVFQTII